MDEDAKKKQVEKKMYREFTVTPGMSGWKIKIGCAELYFEYAEAVGDAITAYLRDPQGTERLFIRSDQRIGMYLPTEQSSAPGQPLGRTLRDTVDQMDTQ